MTIREYMDYKNSESDNKYDSSFRKAELGVKRDNEDLKDLEEDIKDAEEALETDLNAMAASASHVNEDILYLKKLYKRLINLKQ